MADVARHRRIASDQLEDVLSGGLRWAISAPSRASRPHGSAPAVLVEPVTCRSCRRAFASWAEQNRGWRTTSASRRVTASTLGITMGITIPREDQRGLCEVTEC